MALVKKSAEMHCKGYVTLTLWYCLDAGYTVATTSIVHSINISFLAETKFCKHYQLNFT